MNLHDFLTALSVKAREESPPVVDVAGRVIARLQAVQQTPAPFSLAPLMSVAGASAFAAAAMCLIAWQTCSNSDLAMEVFSILSWGMP